MQQMWNPLPCGRPECAEGHEAQDSQERVKTPGFKKSGEPRRVAACGICHKSKLGHVCSHQQCPGPEVCLRGDLHRRKYSKKGSANNSFTASQDSQESPSQEAKLLSTPDKMALKMDDPSRVGDPNVANTLNFNPYTPYNAPPYPGTSNIYTSPWPSEPVFSPEDEEHFHLFREKLNNRRCMGKLQDLWLQEYTILNDLQIEFLPKTKMYNFVHRLRQDFICGTDARGTKRKSESEGETIPPLPVFTHPQ